VKVPGLSTLPKARFQDYSSLLLISAQYAHGSIVDINQQYLTSIWRLRLSSVRLNQHCCCTIPYGV